MSNPEIVTIAKLAEDLDKIKDDYSISVETRTAKVQELINEIVKRVSTKLQESDNGFSTKEIALLNYLHGKALNAVPTFDKAAEQYLAKAIKLDPTLVDAWNCLGECYWKKDDLNASKNCFMGAIEHSKTPNKVSLRRLSMVLRKLGGDRQQRKENIEEALKKAREAVALDVSDAYSWYILGNAHLTNFFNNSFDVDDLQKSLKAYRQSEVNEKGPQNPDLYFNRAVIYKYQEQFQLSINDLEVAIKLDPTWEEPKMEKTQILSFIDKASEFITKKGHVKQKKLNSVAGTLAAETTHSSRTYCPLDKLKAGTNHGKYILGNVVNVMTTKGFLPITFFLMDSTQNFVPVSIYNLADGAIKVGDNLRIFDPQVEDVAVTVDGVQKPTFQCVHVQYPRLLVNDKSPDSSAFAETLVTLEKTSDATIKQNNSNK